MNRPESQMISLWHVSADIDIPKEREFWPRIPKATAIGEEMLTPRICFAPKIEDCLNAIDETSLQQIKDQDGVFMAFHFLVDKHDKFLKSYQELAQDVPDADWTHEHWYLQPLILTGQRFRLVEYQDYKFYRQEHDCTDTLKSVLRNAGWREHQIEKLAKMPLQEAMNSIPYHLAMELADIAGIHELHGFLSLQFTPELTKERSLSNGAHSTHVYG